MAHIVWVPLLSTVYIHGIKARFSDHRCGRWYVQTAIRITIHRLWIIDGAVSHRQEGM